MYSKREIVRNKELTGGYTPQQREKIMTNDQIITPPGFGKPVAYELPANLEPVFDPNTGEFIQYAEKSDTEQDVFVQTAEDLTGTPEGETIH